MSEAIDWSRMAEPQPDGYDTSVVLQLATSFGYRRPEHTGYPTFLDGAVAIRPDPLLLNYDGCLYAPVDHPNIALAESLIRLWPAAYAQCRHLIDTVCFYDHPRLGSDMTIGSICGAGSAGFGSIIVTVNHHMGLAEGIVHEMAHHKLRALGVDIESSSRLLLNQRYEAYPSPIRYDCLRPMCAVLHAQYSYTYIAQLDLSVLAGDDNIQRARAIRERSLAVIVPKLEHGVNVIEKHARADDDGRRFLKSFLSWCRKVIRAGHEDLAASGICSQPFVHPFVTA